MNWYHDLYLGEEAKKKKKKIMHKLDSNSVAFGVYVITLAANGKDLLDVLSAYMLFREQTKERQIIGLALTKEEALEVCEQIILDVYEKTGAYDIRSFFA